MNSYFTIEELCKSSVAEQNNIDNTAPEWAIENLKDLIDFLNPLREAWGSAIKVNSGYRCEKLNEKVGGSKTSAHLTGNAVDLWPDNDDFEGFKSFVLNYLKGKDFDQCIIEKSGKTQWLHFGLYNNNNLQRHQTFSLTV